MVKKRIFTTIAILLTTQLLDAQTGSGNLTLIVSGLKSNNGKVIAAVFNNPDGFPHEREKNVQYQKASIDNNISKLVFNNLSYGHYAVGIIHDENDNGIMDFGVFHIPKEGYGASNNAKGNFGPPDFNDAKFYFAPANSEIRIQINY